MTKIQSYTTKDGKKLFKFQIYIGTDPLTGKRKKTTKAGFKNEKQARMAMSRLQLEIDEGTYQQQKTPETYQEIFDLWVVQYEKTVEESTFVKTLGIFKNHILPSLGEYKIAKINVDVCQRAVNLWFEKLEKFRSVKSYASLVFDFAMNRGYIQLNPMKLIEMPVRLVKPDSEEKLENFYNREQLIQFLKFVENEDDYRTFTFFRLLAYTGMRKGEALALTWNDINFKDNEIRINKALSRGKNSQLYVKTTKNKKNRTIKMDTHTMDILKIWKDIQKDNLVKFGFDSLKGNQLVFSNEENKHLQPTKTREWLGNILKKYKLEKITTHGLRHTHCSLLFEAGVTIPDVQDRLGHDDVQTTINIYTHVTKKAKEEAIRKFVNFLEDVEECHSKKMPKKMPSDEI